MRLGPTDRLTLCGLALLAGLALARHSAPGPLLAGLATLAVAVVATVLARPAGRLARIVHDFFPIVSIVAIFNLTGPVIAVANPARWDATFAALDQRLFGDLPQRWFGLLGRPWWLTDAASLAYVSYYLIPVAMAAALYRRTDRRAFDGLVFTVVAAFLVSYACYFLWPTSGPRVPVDDEARLVGGSALSASLRHLIWHAEGNQLDAFPSGHAALALVFLTLGWRELPRWRLPLALFVAGIVFATVYLSFHYVVDVVAGVALAATLPVVVPALRRLVGGSAPVVEDAPAAR